MDARHLFGDIAQLGEHLPCKQGVESSNLFVSIRDVDRYPDWEACAASFNTLQATCFGTLKTEYRNKQTSKQQDRFCSSERK